MLKVSQNESSIYHKENLIFVQYLKEDSMARTWKENWALFFTPRLWVALYKVFHTSVRCNGITCNYLLGSLDEKKWKLRSTIITYDCIQQTAAVFCFFASCPLPWQPLHCLLPSLSLNLSLCTYIYMFTDGSSLFPGWVPARLHES